MTECKHLGNNYVEAKIIAIKNENIDQLTGRYRMDIRAKCLDCGTTFKFNGLPVGYDIHRPTVSLDQTELRAIIEPKK